MEGFVASKLDEFDRGKVSQEVNVEGLLEHTRKPASVPQPPLRSFKPPVPQKQLPQQPALPRLAEPPKIETAVNAPPITPPAGMPAAPPPQIQTEEKPKLTFETPGQRGTSTNSALAKIARLVFLALPHGVAAEFAAPKAFDELERRVYDDTEFVFLRSN